MQPSRRPKDGRYGENPNRLQHYYQFQVILKPSPPDLQDLYLKSLYAIGIDPALHDIRFVEDDWESPTLGAWGLGWECWCDGMEVSQFTYFQQVARLRMRAGLGRADLRARAARDVRAGRRPRLRSQLQRPRGRREGHLRRRVPAGRAGIFAAQFRISPTPRCCSSSSKMAEAACTKYLDAGWNDGNDERHLMALPAYDQCIKASHVFNLLDARGVISVTERQSYILRVRELAKACGEAWLATEGGGAWRA